VPQRRLDVDAAASPVEDRGDGEVHAGARDCDREHPAAEDLRRVVEPADRGVEDPDRERDERDAVCERDQHLGALVAVRTLGRRGLSGEPDGDEREADRDVVGEHVHGVREQGEASRQHPADELHERVCGGEDERHAERSAARCAAVVVGMRHAKGSTGSTGSFAGGPRWASSARAREDPRPLLAQGQLCVDCHTEAKPTDYVFTKR
jgi:hypothetical protein